jgi:hypothetical protein
MKKELEELLLGLEIEIDEKKYIRTFEHEFERVNCLNEDHAIRLDHRDT